MQVDWSRSARDDLADIRSHIARDSAIYAEHFVRRLLAATRRLRDFPDSGRIIPEVGIAAFREVVVQGYRVMYRRESNRVLVLAVLHGARLVTEDRLLR